MLTPYIILALILLAASTVALQSYTPPRGYWGYAPAVVSKTQGALSNLTVNIGPGTGDVYVGGPLLGSDFQGSMNGAAIAASIVSGQPFIIHNYYYYLKDIGDNVTINAAGPSGSGLASTLTLISLSNFSYIKPFAMTGMIGLAGEILPVGGVKVKAEAVRAYGISKFLVPLNETVKVKGLKVIPVATIIDAAREAGYEVSSKSCGIPPLLSKTPDVFKSHFEKLYNLTMNVTRQLKTLPPDIRDELNYANLTASEGMYYAAASYAFTALIKAYTEYYREHLVGILSAKNLTMANITIPLTTRRSNVTSSNTTTVHGMVQRATKRYNYPREVTDFINKEIKKIAKFTSLQVSPHYCYANYWSFEACAAVYNREFKLGVYLERLRSSSINEMNLDRIATLLALAKARAVSIQLWSDAVKQLAQWNDAPPISNKKLLAREAFAIALGVAKYAYGLNPISNTIGSPIGRAVDIMAKSFYNNEYAKTLGLSVYIYETVASTLMSISNSTAVATEILPLIMHRSFCGTPSFIAFNYFTYVNSLMKTDKLGAEAIAYTAVYLAHMAEVNQFFLNSSK